MDSPVKCKCDNDARRVTVKKEGKNKGREFWQCKGVEKRCGLLIWITPENKSDDSDKKNDVKSKSEKNDSDKKNDVKSKSEKNDVKSKSEKNGNAGAASESTDSPPLCKCGNDARRVTVKKEGKNKGREFWQCKGTDKRCGLLIWITPENKSNETDKKDKAEDSSDSAESNPDCKCGNESRRLTVKKEGKNLGREFYQCKGTDKRCGFFKWIDAAEKSPSKRENESDDSSENEAKKAKVE